MRCDDELDCTTIRSHIRGKQSTQKMKRHLMQERQRKKRKREQFMTAVSTHIRALGRLDVGGEWWVQAECRTSLFFRCV